MDAHNSAKSDYNKVLDYLLELDLSITHQSEDDCIFVVQDESNGIKNLVIGCANPLLIIEQFLFELKDDSAEVYKQLLQKNRDVIHGAFVLDETGRRVIFRDTLQLSNLDLNELEGSINSLALLLSEYSDEIIAFSKH